MSNVSLLNNYLDRSSVLRGNKSWINKKFHDEDSRIIVINNSEVLCSASNGINAVFLSRSQLVNYIDSSSSFVFMGTYNDVPYFTIDVSSHDKAENLCKELNIFFKDLRSIMLILDKADYELLSLAKFLSYWHARNKFCGKCGHKTESTEAGHIRTCLNEECHERHYPNMDPAIIVLVSVGERCLLGRQKDWPEGMYSTLAGYVEPGETLEQAVIREVSEESGITVDEIQYLGSQSWLAPNSLMLGFKAQAKDEVILFDKNELEDVRWFTREEIKASEKLLPYENTIAYKLIVDWLNDVI